ncbi:MULTISPECIES: DUF3124 domain-containing protein [Aestuariibaculum]|uniref:DUF3124 domain-containing protein n=1 Tax=Aestuariibaculum lutulentum TaxID=2920935 RepID=A0ABS9RK75_9FLAO|nr:MULTISPECIES: DUF3124 domain-containing protein [Aestuariibaculum]MCH4553352.1 DUF3124 domain-containing protein [Aestuariibaculum lutulentum]MCR8667778.1 DUF3124 domain-containing protein [Aestuariibaculum sp. M13]
MATKILSTILIAVLFLQSCDKDKEYSSIDEVNWKSRTVHSVLPDSLIKGKTYLSVYSQIYSETEHRIHSLTATVSIRNINEKDTVYIDKATYFDTHGNAIRTYFDKTIYVAPMEAVEIVIDERDEEGGTGANFLFNWRIKGSSNSPFFESVMISTSGQQGISFTTQGKELK